MNLIKIKIISTGFFKLKNIEKDEYIYTRQGEFLLHEKQITDISKKYVLLNKHSQVIKLDSDVIKVVTNKDNRSITLHDATSPNVFELGIWIFRNPMGLIDKSICHNDKEIVRFITSDSSGDSSENSSNSTISIGESNDMSIDTERIGFNWKKMKIKIQSNNAFLKVTNPVTSESFYTRIGDIYINKDGKLCDIGGYLFELSNNFVSAVGNYELSVDYNGLISYKNNISIETQTVNKIKLYKFNNQLGLTDVSNILRGEILAGSINYKSSDADLFYPTTISKTEEIDQVLFSKTAISGDPTNITDFSLVNGKINDKKDPCERFGVNYYKLKFRPLNEYLFRYKFVKSNETLKCYSSDGDIYLILDTQPKLVNILGMELDISNSSITNFATKLGNNKFSNQDLISINEFAEVIMDNEILFKLPMSKIRQEMTVQNSDNLELIEYTVLIDPIKSGEQHNIILDLYNMTYSGPKSSPNYEQISQNLTISSDINQVKKIRLYFDTVDWQTLESQNANIKVITNSQQIDSNEELIYTNKLENSISKIKSQLGI